MKQYRRFFLAVILLLSTCTAVSAQDTNISLTNGEETNIRRVPIVELSNIENLVSNFAISQTKATQKLVRKWAYAKGEPIFSLLVLENDPNIEQRLNVYNRNFTGVLDNHTISTDQILLYASRGTNYISASNTVLFYITEIDAENNETSLSVLSEDIYIATYERYVRKLRSLNAFNVILMIILALTATVALYFIIRLIGIITQKLRKLKMVEKWISKGLKLKKLTILSPETLQSLYQGLVTVLHWVLIIISAYLYLLVVFFIFPFTKSWAAVISTPIVTFFQGIVGFIPNLITIIVIGIVFYYLLKISDLVFNSIRTRKLKIPKFYPEWANTTNNIIKIILIILAVVLIFPYLPFAKSPAALGITGFVGVLVTLGSMSIVSSSLSGIILTYMRSYKKGDKISVMNVTGEVIERNVLVTKLKTVKNEIITIPNGLILSNVVVNYSNKEKDVSVSTEVTIGYDVPWRKVYDLMLAATKGVRGIIPKSAKVLQVSLNDYHITYRLVFAIKEPLNEPFILSSVHENMQDSFKKAKVEILSPTFLQMHK